MMGYVLQINLNMINDMELIKYIISRKYTYDDMVYFNKHIIEGRDIFELYVRRYEVDPINDLLSILKLDDTLIYQDNKIIWPMKRPFEVMDEERDIDYFTMHNIFNKLQTVLYGTKKFDIYYKQ